MTSLKDFFFKNRRKNVPKSCSDESDDSLLHLMRAIARAHASTRVQKVARATSAYDTYCLGRWNKRKMKQRSKASS